MINTHFYQKYSSVNPSLNYLNKFTFLALHSVYLDVYKRQHVNYVINCGLDTVRAAGAFEKPPENASTSTYATRVTSRFFWHIRQTRSLFCDAVTVCFIFFLHLKILRVK